MALRCVIVDAEASSRAVLRSQIEADREMLLVGEASDAESAVAVIAENTPDILFLEVEMPDLNGFDLLALLEARQVPVPATIFVTTLRGYALKAFDASAIDYILKPVDEQRFKKAVRSAKLRRLGEERAADSKRAATGATPNGQRIAIRSKGGKIVFVRVKEVDWIKAEGNYLLIRVGDNEYQFRETMQSFETRVAGLPFARVHRSAMVNVDKIKEVEPWSTGEHVIRLENGQELTLSRTYRDSFFEKMGGLHPTG